MWTKLILGALLGAALLAGADIRGTILIERKLTRHNVTAPREMYQRGVAGRTGSERRRGSPRVEAFSRCVYLEGGLNSTAPRPSSVDGAASGGLFQI